MVTYPHLPSAYIHMNSFSQEHNGGQKVQINRSDEARHLIVKYSSMMNIQYDHCYTRTEWQQYNCGRKVWGWNEMGSNFFLILRKKERIDQTWDEIWI